ncbi:MAG: 23S rRNA (pseudouridine(1915)-N(3))-methyltransferase RlmH [Lachnospiraceae bacterium]|nr:23S rRNA (pseudouridine(1915)-N(3))-methyltransferase RlmH [Lachnospiraceae bacterium]
MEINIHIECKKLDTDYSLAFKEYQKRISPWCKLNLINYKDISNISFKKGSRIFYVTAGTNTISSTELADLIKDINLASMSCIDFVILPDRHMDLKEKGEFFFLSSFDLDNNLLYVALAEQLYRAYTIQNNITYHK